MTMLQLDRTNEAMSTASAITEVGPLSNQPIQDVVRSAGKELEQLLRQRAEILKRIGTVKQRLGYLAKIFGEDALTPEVMHLMGRTQPRKKPGLTRACREVLMEAAAPLEARQGLRELQRRFPGVIDHHKEPIASVTTVFNRLVASAEARSFTNSNGRRAWQWITQSNPASDILSGLDANDCRPLGFDSDLPDRAR